MPRPRVLSFMSQWGINHGHNRSPSDDHSQAQMNAYPPSSQPNLTPQSTFSHAQASTSSVTLDDRQNNASPGTRSRSNTGPSSRPLSAIQSYQPPVMEVNSGTPLELQPIFSLFNSHANKLYQEGYFLKLYDLDPRGRPSPDRTWTECFAQLVGTVLSLWDASALDAAGSDGEVIPTFINLADASIKMIETLPMNGSGDQALQNVLSISTAANNRYLLHFNSLHSLTQWTAGIRLAMYEHTTLQEAYTGSMIAGKGKTINNIRVVMERTRAKHEDWARVRFGAGTPWRRCWCVVMPPDEKEVAKEEKAMKKRAIYDRSSSSLRGEIRFYDNKKVTKRTLPIATIKDAYAAYAIYPQAKSLIDQSTLVKIEGLITIHSNPPSTTEGFVFIMPEVHAMVTGFEIMIRFLFPAFDSFCLYGRPGKLIADVIDPRGLMFAMPNNRRYGYLDILDVAALIHTEGSNKWSERQWRKRMKELTSTRMRKTPSREGTLDSRSASRRKSASASRSSLPPPKVGMIRFDDNTTRSQPSSRRASPPFSASETDLQNKDQLLLVGSQGHGRSVSHGHKQYELGDNAPHPLTAFEMGQENYSTDNLGGPPPEVGAVAVTSPPPGPINTPPTMMHAPGQKPPSAPNQHPELRRANSNFDEETMNQFQGAVGPQSAPAEHSGHAAAGAGGAAFAVGGAAAYRRDHHQNDYADHSYAYQNQHGPRRGLPDAPPAAAKGAQRTQMSPQRLPMIPASPYVDPPEDPSAEPISYMNVQRRSAEHASDTNSERSAYLTPTAEQSAFPLSPQLRNSPTSSQTPTKIFRKPLPDRPAVMSPTSNATSESDRGSLREHAVDPAQLDFVPDDMHRMNSVASSHYDEDNSPTPDYASTQSASTRQSVDKPRPGVLRTVGQAQPEKKEDVIVGDARYTDPPQSQPAYSASNIPSIDFGPTYAMSPGNPLRPNSSGKSALNEGPDFGRVTSGAVAGAGAQARANSQSPRPERYREAPEMRGDNRRSMVWTPGMAVTTGPGQSERPTSFNAEEWVQQRAAAAALQPHMGVRQSVSPATLHARRTSQTPPTSRNSSGDWSQQQQYRSSSRTPEPGRPTSRGASMYLGQSQGLVQSDTANHLSAREQEFVARQTGTSFFDMSKNDSAREREQSGPGLVGAIAAREKERKDMKEGRSGAMVQAAIAATNAHRNQEMMREQMRQRQEQMRQTQQMAAFQAYGNGSGSPGGMPYAQQQAQSPYSQYPPQFTPEQQTPRYYQSQPQPQPQPQPQGRRR